ncbi:MAG: hypothetical protein LBU14_03130 [Candidatus Peribacteria bacterium]|jgi:hypothetical protein|nr:hypothetical protein [Candidatus Peribacteria bacterium]
MFKKTSILIFLLIILASCQDSTQTDTSLILFENDKFSIKVPTNWEIIKDYENVLPKPNI